MNVQSHNIVITDIDIPFGRLVVFIIKWMFASIPALIIFGIFWSILAAILGVIFGGAGMMMGLGT